LHDRISRATYLLTPELLHLRFRHTRTRQTLPLKIQGTGGARI
jgi:hypothetical protein